MKLLIKKSFLALILLAPFVILSLTPFVWFWGKGNVLINGVDTNFPLDPLVWFGRRFFVWNSFANGGSDFSSSTAGLFFHLIQVIPYKLGLNLQVVQIISLIFWFSLIIFSSRFLAKIVFPKNPAVQLLFVVLYSFNIFLFNTWENVKVANLSLIAAIPFTLGILINLRSGEYNFRQAALYSVMTGVIVSGTGINPAYFISFFLVLILFYLANCLVNFNLRNFLRATKEFLFVTFLIVLVNAFWIIPTLYFIFQNIGPVGSIDRIGFNNWINSLSENTSILNIMRGQGAWDWYAFYSISKLPLYIPYALNYFYNLPFILFSFLLPALALVSILVRNKNKRYLYLAFGMMFVAGVFLGSGTHLPTGDIYHWLSNHLPFFTLFRSPWYIFTPLLTLSVAGLIGLLFVRIQESLEEKKIFAGRLIGTLTILVITIGNLVYSYPLVTGKIFRPDKDDGFYVSFPSYIFDAKAWLSQDAQGRIIGYPDDEIEKFKWKYRGVESILGFLVDREVLFPPLNAPDSPIAKLTKQFYQDLKRDELSSAKSIAARLNVSLLFEKADQDSIAMSLPDDVKNLPSQQLGQWIFYKLSDTYLPKIYSASNLVFDHSVDSGHEVIGLLRDKDVLINQDDTVVIAIPEVLKLSSWAVFSQNSQAKALQDFIISPSKLSTRLLVRDPTKAEFEFDIPIDGMYQPALERNKLEDFGIATSGEVKGELDGNETSLRVKDVSDSFVYFEKINLEKGKHKFAMRLEPVNLLSGGFENGPEFTKRGVGDFRILGDQDEKYLSILNNVELAFRKEQDIGARFIIPNFSPIADYLIQFKYKQVYGENAMAIVGQDKGDVLVKIQVERIPNYPEWNTFSLFYTPVRTESEMKIELIAPHIGDPLGTKILYDDLEVYKVFTNKLIFLQEGEKNLLSQPKVNFKKTSPVQYTGTVEDAAGPHVIVFSENYSPAWQFSVWDRTGKKVPVNPLHFSVNTYANAWYVDGVPDSYKFNIYYKPQRLFWLGFGISMLTIFIILLLHFRIIDFLMRFVFQEGIRWKK